MKTKTVRICALLAVFLFYAMLLSLLAWFHEDNFGNLEFGEAHGGHVEPCGRPAPA